MQDCSSELSGMFLKTDIFQINDQSNYLKKNFNHKVLVFNLLQNI